MLVVVFISSSFYLLLWFINFSHDVLSQFSSKVMGQISNVNFSKGKRDKEV